MYEELDKVGARFMMPFTPLGNRSVLSDTLDRAVVTNTVYDYGEVTQSLEIVWGDGSVFRSGSGSVHGFAADDAPSRGLCAPSRGADPSGPGLDFYRIVQGAQGTMGIITWMSAKLGIKEQDRQDLLMLRSIIEIMRMNFYIRLCREESVRKSSSSTRLISRQ